MSSRPRRLAHHPQSPVHVIDSHTGGEPTRVVIESAPPLGSGNLKERLAVFRDRFDWYRTAIINEPRGSDVLVGGLLCEPLSADSAAGVIFFNNVGYLGMCGHGTMGVAVTLAHLDRIGPGDHLLETPAGTVSFTLHDANRVSVRNVPSYRYRKDVAVDVPELGTVVGDIAWGGNWFFLVSTHDQELELANTEQLTRYTWGIRRALDTQGIRGRDDGHIDHIELFGGGADDVDSRNFVLCPGKAYDRSPCGTGTSAKIACLAADGLLQEGEVWRQQSITGSLFEAVYERVDDVIVPTITGTAYITSDSRLVFDSNDPFVSGLPSPTGTEV